ncbi:hypothetical protein XELAEV_18010935mg, partial [Xenopus laevis]
MGTRFAPSYANLFMGMWEQNNILPKLNKNMGLITWKRYIDDCLFIWKGSEKELTTFLEGLNNNSLNIRLTSNYSSVSVNFLDLNIFVESGKFETSLYRKPTDCNGYILRTSCHHKKWLKNIPYSQFNRIKRNCSKNIDYEKESTILTEQFKEKGYEDTVIKHAKTLCDKKSRNEMLQNKNKKEKKRITPDNNSIQFITTYNNSNKELETIIQRHWHILLKDKDLQEHLSANPRIIYKKPRTIKQILVPSCLPPTKQKQLSDPFNTGISNGFFACRTCKGCKTSKVNERNVTNFKSNTTNVEFAIKDIITCNSNNVIYLLQCP